MQRPHDSAAPGGILAAALREHGVPRSFRRDSALFSEGDVAERVFLIEHGWVTLSAGTPEGEEVVLGLRGPGDVVGELSALDGKPRTATALAVGDVEAIVVPARLLSAALGRDPAMAGELAGLLARRLRESDRQRVEFATLDTLARVARRLLELAERFGQETADGVRVDLPLSQERLASWCGSSREATAKALRTLREVSAVTTARGTVTLRNQELVRRHARLV